VSTSDAGMGRDITLHLELRLTMAEASVIQMLHALEGAIGVKGVKPHKVLHQQKVKLLNLA
jgi:hypothetical protein